MTEDKKIQETGAPLDAAVKEMMEAGVFFGRKKSKTSPRMKPYILSNRNGVEIINLHKTLEGLDAAVAFIKEKTSQGGIILLVGTQPAFEDLILKSADDLAIPVVNKRWLGGTLTNFKAISKRIEYFKKLKADMAAGSFEKYTKKERLDIYREIERLKTLMGGLENMNRLPDVMVVVDPTLHSIAVAEARQLSIPVVALTNVDANPDLIDYAVIGNTKGRSSVEWFMGKMTSAIKEARAKGVVVAAKAEEKAAEA